MSQDEPGSASRARRQPLPLVSAEEDGLLQRAFVGRAVELDWLANRVLRRRAQAPLIVSGLPGVGKTTVLRMLFATSRVGNQPNWLNLEQSADPMADALAFAGGLSRDKEGSPFVVIDGAEGLSDEQIEEVSAQILNWKRIRALIFATRRAPIMPKAELLSISALNVSEATELLRNLRLGLSSHDLARGVQMTAGLPMALKMLAQLIERHPGQSIRELLHGAIYNFDGNLRETPDKLIAEIKPKIIVVNERLLEKLRRQPDIIFEIPPRKFEELVAELLDGMGFDVELTKQTRDGGKDILAYMNTGIGKFLCLVEAKKYRQDRTIGVELVRTLYGTLSDYQANSAMLVTTSSFSQDAHAFQRRHEYQLSLRDYGNIVTWIQDHKARQSL